MKITTKITSLKRSYAVSKNGYGIKDKIVLFTIGILNQADPIKWVYLRYLLKQIINISSSNEICKLSMNSSIPSKKIEVRFRLNNNADYQSIYECLDSNMYVVPKGEIKHLFDGGANIGFFTISNSYLPNLKEIVAVEPNPENIPLLENNLLGLKDAIDITIHELAISDVKGKAIFEIFSSNNSQLETSPGFGSSTEKVEVITDSILNLIPSNWDMSKTWLKLDIEGAEYKVVDQLLESELRPAAISMEIHDYLNSGGESLVKRLNECGYTVEISGYGNSGYVCRQITARLNILIQILE